MVGRGRPSAVQLRESSAGVRTWTVVTGDSVTGDSITVGGTKREREREIKMMTLKRCLGP